MVQLKVESQKTSVLETRIQFVGQVMNAWTLTAVDGCISFSV